MALSFVKDYYQIGYRTINNNTMAIRFHHVSGLAVRRSPLVYTNTRPTEKKESKDVSTRTKNCEYEDKTSNE